jgi:cytochrome bd ubiquinol oxidase subunit I
MVDPVALARVQFAANISFHILFPTITMALAWLLVFFKLRFACTADRKWLDAYLFWVKVFALSFALGVVSGLTMSFQFGTNWPGYMEHVGNIAGPLLAYEVLTAFFLEATFLGIMLFGRRRVGERMHTLASIVVAVGTTFSAFWILSLNSWMQTPQGFQMIDGQAHVQSWMAVIFNPSFPYRLTHMLIASGLTACFLMAGISAYRLLRGDRQPAVLATLRVGVFVAAALIPIQIFVGDLHGLNTLKYQPAKIAAMEGIWQDERGAPALLFAMPNEKTRSNDFAIGIPKLASLILTHDPNGEVRGLGSFVGAHPPVAPVFWAFRVMVGMGVLMLAISWWAAWRLRRAAEPGRFTLRLLVMMSFSGWLATLAGWYVTEIGRQPYLVYGVLKTVDAASKVPAPIIGLSLTAYLGLYVLLLLAYVSVLFHMARKAGDHQPTPSPAAGEEHAHG